MLYCVQYCTAIYLETIISDGRLIWSKMFANSQVLYCSKRRLVKETLLKWFTYHTRKEAFKFYSIAFCNYLCANGRPAMVMCGHLHMRLCVYTHICKYIRIYTLMSNLHKWIFGSCVWKLSDLALFSQSKSLHTQILKICIPPFT